MRPIQRVFSTRAEEHPEPCFWSLLPHVPSPPCVVQVMTHLGTHLSWRQSADAAEEHTSSVFGSCPMSSPPCARHEMFRIIAPDTYFTVTRLWMRSWRPSLESGSYWSVIGKRRLLLFIPFSSPKHGLRSRQEALFPLLTMAPSCSTTAYPLLDLCRSVHGARQHQEGRMPADSRSAGSCRVEPLMAATLPIAPTFL